MTGESVDYLTLRIFDCLAYSLVDSQKRNKLECKSKICIFIGFHQRGQGFQTLRFEMRNAFTSRDMVFDKN